jgi:hypothetical protein
MAGASGYCSRFRLPDSDVTSLLIHAAQANA